MGDPHKLQLGGPCVIWPRDGSRMDHLVGACVDLPWVMGSYYSHTCAEVLLNFEARVLGHLVHVPTVLHFCCNNSCVVILLNI